MEFSKGPISNSSLSKTLFEKEQKISDPEIKEKLENSLSIIKETNKRRQLLEAIPYYTLRSLQNLQELGIVNSWKENTEIVSESTYMDCVYGWCHSGYPWDDLQKRRIGDPICDVFYGSICENRYLFAFADGCGWGNEPREAAHRATQIFVQYLRRHHHSIRTTHEAAYLLMRGFEVAHKAIKEGFTADTMMFAGTTTMVAGMVVQLVANSSSKEYGLILASVGDCKAYVCSPHTQTVNQVTLGNRGGVDMRDPGGRIGPEIDNSDPDLRNFKLWFYPCDPDDVVLLVSDGIHDNLDPKNLGFEPKDISPEFSSLTSWPKDQTTETGFWNSVFAWSDRKLLEVITKSGALTPRNVVRSLVEYTRQITEPTRSFMESNPGKRCPEDLKLYPGKIDHTSGLAVKIKKTGSENPPIPNSQTNPNNNNSNSWTKVSPIQFNRIRSNDIPSSNSPEEAHTQIWNKFFGTDIFVVYWDDFVKGVNLPISKDEEQQLKTVIDYSQTGSVTRYKFTEFLKGFGPLESCIENVRKLVSAEWFHGFISPTDSIKFLESTPVGTYLVRFSGSKPGSFTLDYVLKQGHVRSVRLNNHVSGGFEVQQQGGNSKVFKTIHDLITTYSKISVLHRPFSSSITQKPWFWGDISSEEAEALLKDEPIGTYLIRIKGPGLFAASFVNFQGRHARGLITTHQSGYQVNNEGKVFTTLDDLIQHYRDQNIFTHPLEH